MRSKIADIQVFLTSDTCSETDLREIDTRLEGVVALMERAKGKAGGEPCGKS